MAGVHFRFAQRKDVPLVFGFIKELADYEKLSDIMVTTEQDIDKWMFQKEKAEALFIMKDGEEVGFALFFHSFPAYIRGAGLFIEALYIKPEHRGKGYGKAVFAELARIALERGCGRIEWCCLDWNPALEFYRAIGADTADDIILCRLNKESIVKLAQKA
ncbi:MAG: GNAT family N-acetyltransferase [Clostridia bacterium]|nr:GNAT family N-acetyltransferase [Clostridia bacterium]